MEPAQAANFFKETASTWGLGVAVLVVIVLFLCFLLWKLGNRLVASHEKYLDQTAGAASKAAEAASTTAKVSEQMARSIDEIRLSLPTLCKADCSGTNGEENHRRHPRAKPA